MTFWTERNVKQHRQKNTGDSECLNFLHLITNNEIPGTENQQRHPSVIIIVGLIYTNIINEAILSMKEERVCVCVLRPTLTRPSVYIFTLPVITLAVLTMNSTVSWWVACTLTT